MTDTLMLDTYHVISKDEIIKLCAQMLRLYDHRLVDHGERVAFIAYHIWNQLNDTMVVPEILIPLSIFHDVGAYKTEEIDRMLEFESSNVLLHSVYGYLFLKYFTPLEKYSEVILFHHSSNAIYKEFDFQYKDYSNIIHLADRIDVLCAVGCPKDRMLTLLQSPDFEPSFVEAFYSAVEKYPVMEFLQDGRYKEFILDKSCSFDLSMETAFSYLEMLICAVDFKSEHTVLHSITITIVSVFLARQLHLSMETIEKLYCASFIHDIGKMAVPESILEKPGRLTDEQMLEMKKHVDYGESVMRGVIADDICDIALRHHEKLDGSGYPRGLTADQLSLNDRIVAIADIFSALVGKRSYKEAFDKESTLGILWKMAKQNLIDESLVVILADHFENLVNSIQEKTAPYLDEYEKLREEFAAFLDNTDERCKYFIKPVSQNG